MSDNQPKNNNAEDTYDILHKKFSLFGDDAPAAQPEEEDVKNSGEIYFSANADSFTFRTPSKYDATSDDLKSIDFSRFEPTPRSAEKPLSAKHQDSASKYYAQHGAFHTEEEPLPKPKAAASAKGKKKSGGKTGKKAAQTAGRSEKGAADKQGGSRHTAWKVALLVLLVVVTVSLIIRIPIMGCINDILAINRSDTQIRVVIAENMNTDDVIEELKSKNLIYSATFCKLAYKFLGHDPEEIYPAGSYTVSANMGLEGMMREIITAGATESTVSITFPEGYTIDQIVEKLASNGVASSSALYGVVDSVEFIESYDFLTYIQDRDQRYHYLEGYLYPDTYEFYIGENPQSVFNRFLKNFSEKWAADFAERCDRSAYSMDEVLTVASILEKEAKDAEQMPLIASVIYNRLENSSFPFINCDSTAKYIDNQKDKLVASGRYASLLKVYDTYQINGLPIGPICNPGHDAIDAALSPDSTNYYYFIHDATGKIYVAGSLEEHQANLQAAGIN